MLRRLCGDGKDNVETDLEIAVLPHSYIKRLIDTSIVRRRARRARITDGVIHGIWMGDAPSLLSRNDIPEGAIVFGAGTSNPDVTSDGKMGSVIKFATGGGFTHCGIVLKAADNQLRVFEATYNYGVIGNSIEDFCDRYKYVSVYTLPSLQRKPLDIASHFAISQIGRSYSKWHAVFAAPRLEKHLKKAWAWPPRHNKTNPLKYVTYWLRRLAPTSQGTICSAFVIETLIASDIPGMEDEYFNPFVWTPAALAEEHGVFAFTGYVTREGYRDISPLDPALGGNGHLLERWQTALEKDDKEVLHQFSLSLDRAIATEIAKAKQDGMP